MACRLKHSTSITRIQVLCRKSLGQAAAASDVKLLAVAHGTGGTLISRRRRTAAEEDGWMDRPSERLIGETGRLT